MNKTFLLSVILGVLCFPVKAQTLPVPTPVQLQWQQMETTAFVHFSVNTYTDMEWGYGNESPAIFNPTKLDCRQWIRTCKEAGLKGVYGIQCEEFSMEERKRRFGTRICGCLP